MSRPSDDTDDTNARDRETEGADAQGSEAGSRAGFGRVVRVDSLKFDGRLHRSWPARLVRRDGPLIVLEGVFETEVRHALLGTIPAGTLSTEFYWTDRWYSVFRFRAPDGQLRCFYCNVNRPAAYDGDVLSFVDLDIDVLVAPDFSHAVLDEDEFATHAAEFGYDELLRARVRESLSELLRLIETRAFPFDETVERGPSAARPRR